ncbi:hypothetical protein ABH966_001767 [Lysinibacillus sp. RC46]|uniref:hypothetical protein n=1 Tax=Lysinibacillus sp. RC46 TaxID=3156295 RepID=UPI00351104DB
MTLLSVAWSILSVAPATPSVAQISIRHFDSSFRRFCLSIRRSGNPIRRSDFYPSLCQASLSLGPLYPSAKLRAKKTTLDKFSSVVFLLNIL